MNTQTWVTRVVCGAAVLLWTGAGFADDLNNLLRLVQAVAQERSGASRSDRGSRDRAIDALEAPAARSSRDAWKHNQEQGWAEPLPERAARRPSRDRGPVAEGRVASGSFRQPSGGPGQVRSGVPEADPRFRDLHDRARNDRFAYRPDFDAYHDYESGYGHGHDPGYGYDSGYGYDGRFPGNGWVEERQSAALSFSFGSDRVRVAYGAPRPAPTCVPPRPRPIPVPVPVPVPVHQVGEIVRCRVPLATCVRVKGAEHICGHFVPAIVAVRDPALCEHDVERLVYVQVMLPPTPPRKIEVSRCHTRVDLCFGELDVEIVSKNGVISVEYDD